MNPRSLNRKKLVDMLLADREAARRDGNTSAAVTASIRISALLDDEVNENRAARPITKVTFVRAYQTICPRCKRLGPLMDTPPVTPEDVAAREKIERDRAWADEADDARVGADPLENFRGARRGPHEPENFSESPSEISIDPEPNTIQVPRARPIRSHGARPVRKVRGLA